MIQDPTIFTNEGPMMSGTWYNPSNGDSFTVADSFFQDNQYLVKTTDGRILDYNFIQHYVKSDKPIQKQQSVINKQKNETLPKEVTELLTGNNDNIDILEEDLQLISGNNLGNLKNNNRNINTNNYKSSNTNINTELVIVQKALSKTSEPLMNIDITWDNFPSKEIGLLTEVMDINVDDIISYYLSQIDMQEIHNNLAKCLVEFIKNKLGVIPAESIKDVPKENIDNKKVKKTNKKKNIKK